MKMEQLLSILEQEETFLLQIGALLTECEHLFSRGDASTSENLLVRLEDSIEEFLRLEESRVEVFERIKRELNLSDSTTFFDFCKQDSTLMERLFRIVDHLKDISHQVERLRGLFEFHQAYLDFLNKLLNPPSLSTYDSKARIGSQRSGGFKAEG